MRHLYFIVDGQEIEFESRSANPFARLDKSILDRIAINVETLRERIYETVSDLGKTLPISIGDAVPFQVDSATFTICFDAAGEVSILSAAKGNIGAQAGIQITIRRKGG